MDGVARPASLARRVNAATLDAIACVVLAGAAHLIPGDSAAPRTLRAGFVLAPVFLLEPFLIRVAGRTIGQGLLQLRTAPLAAGVALTFPRLLLRYWAKILLGGVSLAYVAFSGRRQALHDRLTGTLVWHAPPRARIPAPGTWVEPESDPRLPPPARRFALFVVWSVIAQVAYVVSVGVVAAALLPDEASALRPAMELALNAGSLTLEVWLLARAAGGRLPGARRRSALPPAAE